jgi:hypothetical protein
MDFNRPPRRRGFHWQQRTKKAIANRRIFPFLCCRPLPQG